MEKENLFMNGCSPTLVNSQLLCSSGMEGQMGEPNCSSEQPPTCYLNLNWENSMDQSAPFDSALSSIVSSPAGSNVAGPTESVIIRELIGRLGSICNSGEISPQSQTLGRSAASYIGGNSSTNTSCYSTPLNSPPKLNLSMMDHQLRGNLTLPGTSLPTHPTLAPLPADPGFAERAARFSCFGSRNFNGLMNPVGFNEAEFAYRSAPRMENGKLSRVSSSQSLKAAGSQMVGIQNKDVQLQDGLETASVSAFDRKFRQFSRSSTPENAEFSIAHEDSSASEKIPVGEASSKGASDANSRKRKGVPRGKVKDIPSSPSKDAKVAAEDEDSNRKRCKPAETTSNEKESTKAKAEPNSSTNTAGDGNQKPPEPPKDYIHVRARRGQATDSHSLAERVRREKISERMKLLQDLVPGCNKVTGKAVMLDEIINYVQSLQRQVEFLSMKLATVNPRLDFNMETLLSKDVLQPCGSLQHGIYPVNSSSSAFPYGQEPQQGPPVQSSISNGMETQFSLNPLDAAISRNVSMQLPPLDGLGEASSQLATFWEDDLQSVVQMGFGQNQSQEPLFQSQSFHGSSSPAHMKLEL